MKPIHSLVLCALVATGPRIALAEMRSVSSYWLDISYDTAQMSDATWELTMGGGLPIPYQLPDGGWIFTSGQPFTIQIVPTHPAMGPTNRALGHVDLMLQFKGPFVMPLDARTSLVSHIYPGQSLVTTASSFWMPEDAQLATAMGRDFLMITAAGSEFQSSSLALAPKTPRASSSNTIGTLPWVTAPAGTGAWQLSLSHELTGATYLVPSQDPDCGSTDCMFTAHGAANLDQLTITMPMMAEFAYSAPVPEPASAALLAGGLLGLVAARWRKLASVASGLRRRASVRVGRGPSIGPDSRAPLLRARWP